MDTDQEKLIRAAFRSMPGIGSQRLRHLIAVFGSATTAWQADKEEHYAHWGRLKWVDDMLKMRRTIDLSEIEKELKKLEIHTVIPDEPYYPSLLSELADAPPILYYKGVMQEQAEGLAFVGARHATSYGKAAAKYLAKEIASQGLIVISGLARGIDTAAHEGALAADGITWAFLGSGLDYIYPSENKRLAAAIMEKGALISEYPPGTPPEAGHFPARNRLISGCSRGVVVVEAARKSGALITVDFALEQGREVFAVPGPIFSEMSKGTHHLLRSGAKIVEGSEDILSEIPFWNRDYNRQKMEKVEGKREFSREEKSLLDILNDVPMHIDQIVCMSDYPASTVALALLELQLAGKVEQLPGQHYVLVRGC